MNKYTQMQYSDPQDSRDDITQHNSLTVQWLHFCVHVCYLFPDSSDFVSVPWQEVSDGSQFLCAMADVPHLIVKMSVYRSDFGTHT